MSSTLRTGLHLLSAVALTPLSRRLPRMVAPQGLRLRYADGHGVLREVLAVVDELQLSASVVSSRRIGGPGEAEVDLLLRIEGRTDLRTAAVQLSRLPGVLDVAQQRLENESGD